MNWRDLLYRRKKNKNVVASEPIIVTSFGDLIYSQESPEVQALMKKVETGQKWIDAVSCIVCGNTVKSGYFHYSEEAEQAMEELELIAQKRYYRNADKL